MEAEKKGINIVVEQEPPPGPLNDLDMYTVTVGMVLGVGLITYLPLAIQSIGLRAGLLFPLVVITGILYTLPYFFAASAFRQGGGMLSVVAMMSKSPFIVGIYACSNFLSPLFISVFVLTLGNYFNAVLPAVSPHMAAIIALTILYIANMFGTKMMARLQNFMFPILAVGLILFIVFAFAKRTMPILNTTSPDWAKGGPAEMLNAWYLLLLTSTSYMAVSALGRDCKDARRQIPKSMLMCLITIAVLYLFYGIAATTVLPVAEIGITLVSLAKAIFPGWLFAIWLVMVPLLLVATTANSTLAQNGRMLGQTASDGWLPKSWAKVNKYGAPYRILTIIYVLTLVPLVFKLSVSAMVQNLALVSFFAEVLFFISLFWLPRRHKKAWKQAKWHVPTPVLYVSLIISIAIKFLTMVNTFLHLNPILIVVTLSFIGCSFLWAIYRVRSGKGNIVVSAWYPGMEEDREEQPVAVAKDD